MQRLFQLHINIDFFTTVTEKQSLINSNMMVVCLKFWADLKRSHKRIILLWDRLIIMNLFVLNLQLPNFNLSISILKK